ncbi:hypothetical protein P9112_007005 [Eukaryota sp. TZLM1-RC]
MHDLDPHSVPVIPGYGDVANMTITSTMKVTGEVNKVRSNVEGSLAAAYTTHPDVLLFDIPSRDSNPNPNPQRSRFQSKDDEVSPLLTLTGHFKEGFGLDWARTNHDQSIVASSGNDGLILVWDVGDPLNSIVPPFLSFGGWHDSAIGDVAFQPRASSILAAVDDNSMLAFWDLRAPNLEGPKESCKVNNGGRNLELNCVQWCEFRDPMLLVAGKMALWS